MVWHHMSLKYLYAFVFTQSPDYLLQICAILIVYDLPTILRYEYYVILTDPFRVRLNYLFDLPFLLLSCCNRLEHLIVPR